MRKIEVNPGDKYGMLTIVKFHHEKVSYYERKDASYRKSRLSKRVYRYYECKCECGNTCVVEITHLRTGHTVSCGCYREWKNKQPNSKRGTHGMSGHDLYGVWCKIHQRCYSENSPFYSNYGGRGIKMSDEWEKSPLPFIAWAERNGWYRGCNLSADRIDVNGDYSEENCRLATSAVQNRNKRNNRYITFNGEVKTITDWANSLGITASSLSSRLSSPNWTFEDAMTKVSNDARHKNSEDYDLAAEKEKERVSYNKSSRTIKEIEDIIPRPNITVKDTFEFNGVSHTVAEWAEFMGMKSHVLLRRLKLGWHMKDALFLSPRRRDMGTN